MCEFHDSNCNGFGDMWWTDKCTYLSSIDVGCPNTVNCRLRFLHETPASVPLRLIRLSYTWLLLSKQSSPQIYETNFIFWYTCRTSALVALVLSAVVVCVVLVTSRPDYLSNTRMPCLHGLRLLSLFLPYGRC